MGKCWLRQAIGCGRDVLERDDKKPAGAVKKLLLPQMDRTDFD
jgi:hypothetical protein